MASLSNSRKEKNQNIQVFARLRPINARERDLKSIGIVEVSGSKEIIVKQVALDNKLTKRFTFDRVFGPNSKQVDVYQEVVSPLIEEVLAGYNCTVFAYGQTGTGKTHTMVGESSGDGDIPWQNDPMSGIIPRSLSQLFDELRITNSEYTVRVSYLELYNEELFDLLSSSEDNSKLRIYEDVTRKGSNIVNGLEEMTVYNKNEVYKIMEKGQEKRRIASTLMNAQSSRSHTVFTIVVHMKENSPEGEELMKIGKLNLVDLAGSENISKAGSDNPARKERARECVNINQSLLTLGRVITALVERHPHIPYRESKLTRLLQESLGGRTKTSIIATISPGHRDVEETLSTLEYAHRARNIQNKPEINQKMTKKAVLKEYSEEIDRLKRDLQASRERNGIYLANETYAEMTLKIEDQEKEIQEQILFIKAMKEEKDKVEGLFSEISDNLKETENQLNITNQTLNQTKVALSDKNQELLVTKNEVEEQKYLVHKQVETEKILMEQAKTLIDVADITKKDVELLHSTVEKKRALEYNNLNVAKTFGDHSQSHRTHIKDHVNEFSKSHLEHLSKLQENLNQHDNDHMNNQIASKQIINEMCEKIKEMFTVTNNAKEVSIKQISECTENNFLIMQNVNESSYVNVNDKINKLLALLVRLNDAREQDRLSVEQMKLQVRQWKDTSKAKILSLRHVNSEWWNDINNHMKHLEEQFEVNTNTHLQDNQALLELRKEYDDEISSDVAKLREMIVSLEEKQIKHKNIYSDMQQKHRSSMVLSKELYANTLLHGKETLSSKIQGVNNIVDMLDEVNKTSVKDITTLVEDYDKIIDIGKIINSDFKDSLDDFAKSNTEYWADSLNKTKDAKNNIKQTQEKCIIHHHATFNEFLNRYHSETCNILNPIEDTIQNITKNAGEIEREFHHLKTSMGDFHTKLQSDLVINDDLEMKFLTEDYKLYSPTGKTPIRREYLYPRNIKNTSPHERILMRLRNSRNKKFVESSPLQIDHVIDLDQTIEMTPLKRTVENSQSETNHIMNGMITPIILDSPDVVFTEPKPVHNSSLQNNSTTTSPPNDDIYDANDFKQSKENLNISSNDKKETLSKLRQPSSVKKILGSKN